MYIDFSGLFHQSSKDRSGKGRVKIPQDETLWPPEWREIVYKEYPRFPKIALQDTQTDSGVMGTIRKRRSRRGFKGEPVSAKSIGALLKHACGIVQEGDSYHRAQPSGGGRYPIEAYVLMFVGTHEIPSGVYHYNVKQHALDSLWERPFTAKDIGELFTYPWAQEASLAIILTGVFARNQMKYGERGYRQILIEAGTIVQNIYLTSTDLGLKCCAIEGVREPNIEKVLDIDGYAESAICSLVLG